MEAIGFGYHQTPIQFSQVLYRNPVYHSRSPSGQTILFGCPLELRTVGELKKIPLILEYLLDFVYDWPRPYFSPYAVGHRHKNCTTYSLYCKMEKYWPLVHELEQAWTGVEESDRAIISMLAQQGNHRFLIMVCLL